MSWHTVDINIDAQEIIEKIPTSILEEELKDRKELQVSDSKAAERAEQNRTSNIEWEIDPDDYDDQFLWTDHIEVHPARTQKYPSRHAVQTHAISPFR